MAIQELTTFQLGLLSLLAIGLFLFFLLGVLWLRRKYPKAERFNSFLIAFMLIAGLYLISMLSVAIGIYTKEDLKKATPYFGGALILFWVLIYVAMYWGRKPIPTERLWNEYVLPTVKWKWNGRVYHGQAYMPSIRFNKVVKTAQHPMLRQYAGISDIVEVFFGVFISHTKFVVIQVHNKFTGEDVYGHHNPSYDVVLSLLGKEALSSYTEAIDEIQEHPQEEKQPERERGTYIRQ